jgi:hypothetical protein
MRFRTLLLSVGIIGGCLAQAGALQAAAFLDTFPFTNSLTGDLRSLASDGTNVVAATGDSSSPGIGPAYVAFGANKFLTVWLEGSSSSVDLHAQFVGSAPFIALSAVPTVELRSLTWDGKSFLIVWSHASDGLSALEGQILDPSGLASGSPFLISSPAAIASHCAATAGTNHLVAWMESPGPTNEWHTRVRVINAAGVLSEITTLSETPAASAHPLTLSWGDGKALAVWNRPTGPYPPFPACSIPNTNFWLMLYGRMVDANGSAIDSEFQLPRIRAHQTNPRLAFDGARYLLVSTDSRRDTCGGWLGCGSNGCAQLIDSGGKLIDVEFIMNPECWHPESLIGLQGQFVCVMSYTSTDGTTSTRVSYLRDVNLGKLWLKNLVVSTNGCSQLDVAGDVVPDYGPPVAPDFRPRAGYYTLQASTNLVDWQMVWRGNCDGPWLSALLFPNTNVYWQDPFANYSGARFFRGVDQKSGCRSNLRLIEHAKALWAFDQNKSLIAIPTDADLFGPNGYFPSKPACPGGGSYVYDNVANHPHCSLFAAAGHTL